MKQNLKDMLQGLVDSAKKTGYVSGIGGVGVCVVDSKCVDRIQNYLERLKKVEERLDENKSI